jgi:sulfite exporter TauE/SafE
MKKIFLQLFSSFIELFRGEMTNPFIYSVEGLLLGLATGPICLATCGPVYAPYLMQKSHSTLRSIITLLQISAGRFVTYLVIGLSAGALGTQIATLPKVWLTVASYVLFSVVLIISSIRTGKCDVGCHLAGWTRFAEVPFILGMATGLSFCPSFLLAVTKAVDHGGLFAGAFLFGAFFIGTTIYFIPIVLFGVIGKTYRLRMIGRIASFAVALWFLFQAIMLMLVR